MNSFGRIFRLSLFGESHGAAIGVTIDGVPAGIALSLDEFTNDIQRRKAGQKGTTPRIEDDIPEIVSGWFNGFTTGSPLTILFRNNNIKPDDYSSFETISRPGHADFVAHERYKMFNDFRGGGHFSGRLTLSLVAAGVVAKKIVNNICINANVLSVGGSNSVNEAIDNALKANDSVGGIVECRANNIPVGWGEPFFDSVESVISHLAFAVPAIKGIEFGSGFQSATMFGSQHNDSILDKNGITATNNAGGINGGLTNGNELIFRVAVKPTSSITKKQQSFNFTSEKVEEFEIKGRHDVCIALRIPVVIEAITAIALADFSMIHRGIC